MKEFLKGIIGTKPTQETHPFTSLHHTNRLDGPIHIIRSNNPRYALVEWKNEKGKVTDWMLGIAPQVDQAFGKDIQGSLHSADNHTLDILQEKALQVIQDLQPYIFLSPQRVSLVLNSGKLELCSFDKKGLIINPNLTGNEDPQQLKYQHWWTRGKERDFYRGNITDPSKPNFVEFSPTSAIVGTTDYNSHRELRVVMGMQFDSANFKKLRLPSYYEAAQLVQDGNDYIPNLSAVPYIRSAPVVTMGGGNYDWENNVGPLTEPNFLNG